MQSADVVTEGPVVAAPDLVVTAHHVFQHLGGFGETLSEPQHVLNFAQGTVPFHVFPRLEECAVDPRGVKSGAADGSRVLGGDLCGIDN